MNLDLKLVLFCIFLHNAIKNVFKKELYFLETPLYLKQIKLPVRNIFI